MKKLIAIIITIACVGLLVGCSCNSTDSNDSTTEINQQGTIKNVPANSTETRPAPDKTIIVSQVPTQKKPKDVKKKKQQQVETKAKKTKALGGKITGMWTFEGGIFVYTFKTDGSGVYTTGSESKFFTYKTKGNKVIIKYKDGGTVTMPYTVKGDMLLLKDENGDDVPYYKSHHKKPKM